MDSKAERKQQILTVHNLYFEPLKLSKATIGKVTDAIKAFARFNQCREIVIKKSNSREHLKSIKQALAQ
jgi:uncharacterized protein YcaQ